MLVKICGITNPEDALAAAQLGADFIGIVFDRASTRYVSHEKAKEIVKALQGSSTKVVGVFTTPFFDEIEMNIRRLQLDCVQVYTTFDKPFSCEMIHAIPHHLSTHADAVYLIESEKPGSGKAFDWNAFTPPKEVQWILAGGLTPKNVRVAVETLSPMGVDVSSGVEREKKGIKDLQLMKHFIEEAKR